MIFTVLLAAMLVAGKAQARVLVIANPGVKAADISKNDLRDVFTGAATTLHYDTRVVPILLKAGTVNEEFLKAYIGKNDATYRAGWRPPGSFDERLGSCRSDKMNGEVLSKKQTFDT